MFDDVASIFHNNVVSAYESYVAHRDSSSAGRDRHLRSAIETAAALFHFREHLPAGHQMSRGQAEKDCSDFLLIADVVNATKHRQLTKGAPIVVVNATKHRQLTKGAPIVKSAEDVQEYTIVTRYADNEGEYSGVRTLVQVRCVDGITRNLDLALTNVLNFWGGKLKEWGIVEYMLRPAPEVPGARHLGRDEVSSLDLEALRGLRFRQRMQLLKFNYEKGHAEPVDLTDAKLEFRIYRPAFELNLEFTRRDTGQKVGLPFALSEEESIYTSPWLESRRGEAGLSAASSGGSS